MSSKRLVIAGDVQGVGYRAWASDRAAELGIAGWIRNRPDGTVEALISGTADAVEEMARACRRGPRHARVTDIVEVICDPPAEPGFQILPLG